MEQSVAGVKLSTIMTIVLCFGSVLALVGSVFLIQIFSLLYGIADGASLQSVYTNGTVIQGLQQLVSQSTFLHDSILESYVLVIIATLLSGIALMLLLRRQEKGTGAIRRYAMMHSGFLIIYLLVFFIIYVDSAQYLNELYVYMLYLGLALCVAAGLYLNAYARMYREQQAPGKVKRSIHVDPSTPFSNIDELRDTLIANFEGHLRIIDKNFNSAALSNFNRLISKDAKQFELITIITSTDMMDSGFSRDISEFRKELDRHGVKAEFRLMDEADKVEQHERIMLDDKIAYKIPPLNIINSRSEHIIMINYREAERRYNYLYGRGINLENYAVKKSDSRPQ